MFDTLLIRCTGSFIVLGVIALLQKYGFISELTYFNIMLFCIGYIAYNLALMIENVYCEFTKG